MLAASCDFRGLSWGFSWGSLGAFWAFLALSGGFSRALLGLSWCFFGQAWQSRTMQFWVLYIARHSISQATVGCSRWQARPMVEAIRKPGNHASGLVGVSMRIPICPFTSRLRPARLRPASIGKSDSK